VSTNPVAKHLNKFNKPKRINNKKNKKHIKTIKKEIKKVYGK
jgi:hypothetical protein